MRKILKRILFGFLIFLLIFLGYFFVGTPPRAEKIIWGVNFSQKHAKDLGLNWKETYLALLDDLGVKDLKLITHWDLIEPSKGEYHFEDLDWQIKEAKKREAKILLVIGMKTPRWPECHIPEWAKNLSKGEQQERILNLIEKIVQRYTGATRAIRANYIGPTYGGSIWGWQVENEPFFPFGDCPWVDKNFLKKEIDLVKSLDPHTNGAPRCTQTNNCAPSGVGVDTKRRPIIISDSGEGSFWIQAARFGDIVGTTMYKRVWFRQLGIYIHYPFPPVFYWRKAQVIKKIFKKEVICVELQAEPWGPVLLYDLPIEEQEKTMNLEQFKKNIDFAKKTGLREFYLWGAEWWFWMKEKQDRPEIWTEAKKLF